MKVTMTSSHVMTLANSIIGVGILAMPFCFQKCGIILSIVLLIINNWISRISCHYLIKSSLLTRKKSFELLGLYAFGYSGKLFVELCTIGYLIGTCITYFVVVGDIGPQIVAKIFNISNKHELRSWVMVAVTVICIIPLAMLKNVDSLSAVCTASVGFYVCFVLKIILESKKHITASDWNSNIVYWDSSGILQCLPIFSMALSCQMQLFEIFESINNQSIEKLNSLVRNATWICTFVYISVGIFGYIAFCTQELSGNILIDFAPSFGIDVIKIGFVFSIAFSFPLVIFPCRASIYSLLYRRGHADISKYIPENRFKSITVIIILISLFTALLLPSVELVIGLVGSTIGVAICVIFPASCFRKITKKDSTEKTLAQVILLCGFSLMILGTYANLNAIDEKRSKGHDYIVLPLTKPTQNIETFQMLKMPDVVKVIKHIPVQNISIEEKFILKNPIRNITSTEKVKSIDVKISNKMNNKVKVMERKKLPQVVDEETKMPGFKANDQNAVDIEKAQDELKRTKEMLAKKVDELKEEIAKHNVETQNFVAEKLDEVVSKVEKIERQVNEKVNLGKILSPKTNTDQMKFPAVNVKDENPIKKIENNSMKKVQIENDKVITSKQDHRIPLPLPLLVNISQVKELDDNLAINIKKSDNQNETNEIPSQDKINGKNSNNEVMMNNLVKRERRSTNTNLKTDEEASIMNIFLNRKNLEVIGI